MAEQNTIELTKEQVIDNLIANCNLEAGEETENQGPWNEEDKEALNVLNEEKLVAFHDQMMTANAKQVEKKKEEEEGEEDGKGKKTIKVAKVENAQVINSTEQPKTLDQWMADAPAEIVSVVNNAMSLEKQQKADLISKITKNEKNIFDKKYLNNQSLDELRGIAALAIDKDQEQSNTQVLANYSGAMPGFTQNLGEDFAQEDLDMVPTATDYSDHK